jgi:hypothetical protein
MNTSSPAATGAILESETRYPGARLNQHRQIESEMSLEEAREIPLHDMNQAELMAVILHDPDISERRMALRLFKLEIVLDAENKVMRALNEARR